MSTQTVQTATPDEFASEVGFRIKSLMWRREVTGTTIADALGIGRSTVSAKLKGRVAITMADLATIAQVLEVDPAELLPRVERETATPEGGRSDVVRHQGLEPRTRWFEAFGADLHGLTRADLMAVA